MNKNKKICLCGNEFVGNKYCSRKCVYKFGARLGIPLSIESRKKLSKKYMGSGSPSWKGGVSKDKNHTNQLKRNSRNKRRKIVIDFYGGKCACCGQREYKFLAIDHIHNDGAKHRKIVGNDHLFQSIIKEGLPPNRYQILCHNCNFAKSHWGGCPHQIKKHDKTT